MVQYIQCRQEGHFPALSTRGHKSFSSVPLAKSFSSVPWPGPCHVCCAILTFLLTLLTELIIDLLTTQGASLGRGHFACGKQTYTRFREREPAIYIHTYTSQSIAWWCARCFTGLLRAPPGLTGWEFACGGLHWLSRCSAFSLADHQVFNACFQCHEPGTDVKTLAPLA